MNKHNLKRSFQPYLYNAISRARVLCQVHLIVTKDEAFSESEKKLEELLKLFPDAKIKDEAQYVAELMNLMYTLPPSSRWIIDLD